MLESYEQSTSLFSNPLQRKSSRWMGPVPTPNLEVGIAVASVELAKTCSLSFRVTHTANNQTQVIVYLLFYFLVLTEFREPELSAGYSSIKATPQIITNSSPDFVNADFHATFIGVVAIPESDVTTSASCVRKWKQKI